MYRQVICTMLLCTSAAAHEMTPTYPLWAPSFMPGVAKTTMEMFNKRRDVEWYEIGVFDREWNAVPFVSNYRVMHMPYLSHVKFDLYVSTNDIPRAEYVCSVSKLRENSNNKPQISSRICSRFE